MAVAVDLELDGGTLDQYDEVAKLMDYEPAGRVGSADDSLHLFVGEVRWQPSASARPPVRTAAKALDDAGHTYEITPVNYGRTPSAVDLALLCA